MSEYSTNTLGVVHEKFLRVYESIVPEENGCMLWTRGFFSNGYPVITDSDRRARKGNRVALEVKLGRRLEAGEMSLHTCDNKRCVSFDHLYVGDHKQNMRDAAERGRMRSGDSHPSRRAHNRVPRGDAHYSRTRPEVLCRGVDQHAAKLTEDKVREARAMKKNTRISYNKLALHFGVAEATIREAVLGLTWRHVQ